ncbi:hypothetical protein SAMN05421878_104120 [Actinobaculum suis]|uniref:Uncharacterized protein n=1 Tax=Actinobaculum suis TaxID=1657 RepID=A0A1G7BCX4_9ACTO|nr:hypothetical protein [Actinobaculum suis]MDY5153571.1 hypothetical protein [Actinobaculum suis]SDE24954.1 hypothetical protein SAMN05421878_104120 [Actinobaculum suis]
MFRFDAATGFLAATGYLAAAGAYRCGYLFMFDAVAMLATASTLPVREFFQSGVLLAGA